MLLNVSGYGSAGATVATGECKYPGPQLPQDTTAPFLHTSKHQGWVVGICTCIVPVTNLDRKKMC